MKKSKTLITLIVLCLMMSSMFSNVYASDEVAASQRISESQLTRLKNANISEVDISSLYQQIEVYNPTDEMIENYISDLILNYNSNDEDSNTPIDYEETENGDIITPYGIIPYQDLAQKWETWEPESLAGSSKSVKVTIPSFPVTLNSLVFDDNDYAQYPLLFYKDITYFPMTYYKSNLMNLNTTWTSRDGLSIQNNDPETPKVFAYDPTRTAKNRKTQTATVIGSKVTVNGKVINNKNEPYPLLLFRDVTYFPMTWRFSFEEFGWNYSFDNKKGLIINADNFFYTANGDSYIEEDGSRTSVYNETHYIHGDLEIHMNTKTVRLLGPTSGNLSIIKNGETIGPKYIEPLNYFGYFQKNGPLFTVDEKYVYTTYYSDPDHPNTDPCRVNIETGEIISH